ncbi:MAG: sodium:proton antiporter, partial [Lachnospiraceae bacterium]|nr:sodium:proton antiporter [Lachnospiraceae bacterium]
YMGIGMVTQAGMTAIVFHILSHAATKSLLFIAAIGLTDVSGGSRKLVELTGAAYRNKWAGAAFTVGSLSMVGVPLFSGFISKLLFSQAAVQNGTKMLPALIVLGVSTILNAIYFMKTVIRIYTPVESGKYESISFNKMKLYCLTLVFFVVLNVILGVSSQPIVDLIEQGLVMFS